MNNRGSQPFGLVAITLSSGSSARSVNTVAGVSEAGMAITTGAGALCARTVTFLGVASSGGSAEGEDASLTCGRETAPGLVATEVGVGAVTWGSGTTGVRIGSARRTFAGSAFCSSALKGRHSSRKPDPWRRCSRSTCAKVGDP